MASLRNPLLTTDAPRRRRPHAPVYSGVLCVVVRPSKLVLLVPGITHGFVKLLAFSRRPLTERVVVSQDLSQCAKSCARMRHGHIEHRGAFSICGIHIALLAAMKMKIVRVPRCHSRVLSLSEAAWAPSVKARVRVVYLKPNGEVNKTASSPSESVCG